MNAVTGEKIVEINGQRLVMRFDWRALAEVEQRHGDKPNLFSSDTLAAVAAIGLRGKHPEMTAEQIIDLSPPLVPLAQAVQTALQWAYFGPEAVTEASEDSKKKNAPRLDGFWRRIVRLLRPGSHQ